MPLVSLDLCMLPGDKVVLTRGWIEAEFLNGCCGKVSESALPALHSLFD